MIKYLLILIATYLGVQAQSNDYIDSLPPSVYEATEMSPQNMDFDSEANMFPAHSCFYKDKFINYYKFRVYAPGTYPNQVPADGSPDFPISPFYIFTTTEGDFSSVISDQQPVIQNVTSDGETYSDFARIYWVVVDDQYEANSAKSYGDITALQENGSANVVESDIYANIPVVPVGSTLQDPQNSDSQAPIQPVQVWYRGVEAQVFIFETTSQEFADYFNPITREGDAAENDSGYEITVSPFVDDGRVSFAPIWHLNQYTNGVVPGENNGGPWENGMRNIIDVDRKEDGYSPLWQLLWVSKVPVNYSADEASSSEVLTADNGFTIDPTPMYVNCPNVGPHGGQGNNENAATTFGPQGSPSEYIFQGALVMEADVEIDLYINDNQLASNSTNPLGGYMIAADPEEVSDSAEIVTRQSGETTDLASFSLSSINVERSENDNDDSTSSSINVLSSSSSILPLSLLALCFGTYF